MKDFIRDNGKVRRCTSNESKMNIFEWIYYYPNYFSEKIIGAFEEGYKAVYTLFIILIFIILLILFPITFPIVAYINIKNAKKEMILLKKYNRKGE